MKIVVAILILLVAVLAFGYVHERTIHLDDDAKIASLKVDIISAKTPPAPADGKERVGCAQRAAAFFKDMGYEEGPPGITGNFTNHYNSALGRCFIRIDTTSESKNGVMRTSSMYDADERTDLGEFATLWKDANEQQLVMCSAFPPGKSSSRCKSNEEWEAFAKTLMD